MTTSIKQRLPILMIAAFTLLAGAAQATHWPQAGGDYGRSGHQPADQAALPMKFRWQGTATATSPVATSPIVTAGATLVDQRVAYGRYTRDGAGESDPNARVRLQRFSDGTGIGLDVDSRDKGVDIDDEQARQPPLTGTSDTDSFGTVGDVAPVEASGHTGGPTQIYAVHNDDNQANTFFNSATGVDQSTGTPNPEGNDIALAQIRASDGRRLRDWSIGDDNPVTTGIDTDGYTVDAAPAIGPDESGNRRILFTASNGTDKRLFVVTVNSAASDAPNTFSLRVSPNLPNINTRARVAYVNFKDPDGGFVVPMALIPTLDGLITIRLGDEELDDFGPAIEGLGATWSPSVPVQANGNSPSTTPFFYVASQTPGGTIVSKLRQMGANETPDASKLEKFEPISQSRELSGTPGRGLAVAQEGTAAGRVVVTTSANVYVLSTENLSADNPPQLFDADAATGFANTVPATSGNLGFAVTDGGQQYVFFLTPQDGELRVPLDEGGFQPNEQALNSTASVGQPALSRGRVVMPANNGVFVYGPTVTLLQPQANARLTGTPTAPAVVTIEAYVFDPSVTTVTFRVDDQVIGSAPVENNRAQIQWNTGGVKDGPHRLTAVAGDESSAPRIVIVDNFRDPTAQLTAAPTPANVNQDVTLNAAGSAITPGESETIVEYAFDIDGDNDFSDGLTGTQSSVTTRFATPGSKTVSVRVRDSNGDTAIKSVTFRVNAPPTVSLAATPNPAAPGQAVTIDATGSSDSDGSITRYEFDLDGNNTFELDNGSNPKTTKAFAATTNVSVRVTDNEGGQSIKTVTVTVAAANQPPVASFIVAPNPAAVNQDVGFSAAGSKDPDGQITKYEWDFDGDGTFETPGGVLVARKFTQPGVVKVGLRVTDNAGATATTTVDLIVTGAVCAATQRCKPRSLSASVTPRRDRSLPWVFRTSGRLRLPTGLRAADGCKGRVLVQVKLGKKTISSRRVKLRSTCRYSSKVTFRERDRLGIRKTLRFIVKFQGNKVLSPRSAKLRKVRIG